jgi:hypothetical protein
VIYHRCGWIDLADYEEEQGSTMGVEIWVVVKGTPGGLSFACWGYE